MELETQLVRLLLIVRRLILLMAMQDTGARVPRVTLEMGSSNLLARKVGQLQSSLFQYVY